MPLQMPRRHLPETIEHADVQLHFAVLHDDTAFDIGWMLTRVPPGHRRERLICHRNLSVEDISLDVDRIAYYGLHPHKAHLSQYKESE